MYGNKIRMIRLNRGLSQEDVAKKLGTSQNAYSKIENNHIKLNDNNIQQLAEILGVNVADIKNPEPIIVNLNNNNNANNYNREDVSFQLTEKLLDQLAGQLQEKDRKTS